MASEEVFASVEHTSGGLPYFALNAEDGTQPVPVLPPLPLTEEVTKAAQKHLERRYLALTPEQLAGPTHKASYLTRCIFIDTSLWNEPAMAPTAVVPTLPEKRGVRCGYQQLELGDEEQLARYPVLQAIRSGIKLDSESYTRGSYQTVPIVPGGTAWGKSATTEGLSSKAQGWLAEYMRSSLPSVPLEALGASCFSQQAAAAPSVSPPQVASVHQTDNPESILRDKSSGRVLSLSSVLDGIYLGDSGSSSSGTLTASTHGPLSLPGREAVAAAGAAKLPPRPPSTPGSDRLHSGGKRVSAEKALQRATLSEKALSKSGRWHGDRASGGSTPSTPGGSGITLNARNLGLIEKVEKNQTKKHAMASRPESVAVAAVDEEELEALAGVEPFIHGTAPASYPPGFFLKEEQRDEVPDLPVHDDLELVLRASEMTIATPSSAPSASPGAAAPVLRARSHKDKEFAMENSVRNLPAAFEALRPRLAMTWPFELDTFQKQGVVLMEQGESVFVAAHTSAGKTVLAEYAFALAELHKTKAVYTAPVKAISNQKFRDLGKKFDVGLLTGDVQIKPEANCLIMTTEVLRSMLYRGANVVRDIEWVIFDEVHYISDDDRGIVYEEVIIMLPPHVNIVMLSATVPNKVEFADWVGGIRQKAIHICGTDKRPVPLQHNLYFHKALHPICTAGHFDEKAFMKAQSLFKNAGSSAKTRGGSPARPGPSSPAKGGPGRGGGGGGGGRNQQTAKQMAGRAVAQHARSQGGKASHGGGERQQWTELIRTLKDKELLPCINFMFSKKKIAMTAEALMHLDMCTEKEKAYIHSFIDRSLSRLKPEDRELPQIKSLRLMLASGVAMHHAGLLPIMKEVVEMLFCEGLVKVLFATDTFAMGVNAPARSVSFWYIKKPDGEGGLRLLRPEEYVQMAGRAGRRGLDDVGTVLVAVQPDAEFPQQDVLRNLMTGKSGSLQSKFRLEYRMILSLLRVRDFKVEDMMRSSFSEFASQQQFPAIKREDDKAGAMLQQLTSKPWPEGPSKAQATEYLDLATKAAQLHTQVKGDFLKSKQVADRLVAGAMVLLGNEKLPWPRLSVVLGLESAIKALAEDGEDGRPSTWKGSKQRGAAGKAAAVSPLDTLFLLTLHDHHSKLDDADARERLQAASDQFSGMQQTGSKGRYGESEKCGWMLHAAAVEDVLCFVEGCKARVAPLHILTQQPQQRALHSAVTDLLQAQEAAAKGAVRLPGVPDPRAQEWKEAIVALQRHPAHRSPHKAEALARIRSERALQARQKDFKAQLAGKNLSLLPEYGHKLALLQHLAFVSDTEVVKMKGRVACEISTCECLIATEAIFQGLFSELTPAEAVSLLCCLVNQNKAAAESFAYVPAPLKAAVEQLTSLVHNLGELQCEKGLELDLEKYAEVNVRPSLTEVTYLWAEGQLFSAVCGVMPEGVMEGDVVRTVTRLEHACQDMCNAARVMGNTALYDQFEEASRLIKRDIIFAASLYVS